MGRRPTHARERMLRCTPQQLCTLEMVELVGEALSPRAERSA
jgi:hypothetical protein